MLNAISSLFAPKKKAPAPSMSVAPNMSVAPKQQPAYSQATKPQPTAPKNNVGMGNGMESIKSVFAAPKLFNSTPKPAQNMSVAKPAANMSVAPKPVQGSGYGNQFSSNPSNYKAPTPTPPPTPTPAPQPEQQNQNPTNEWLDYVASAGNQRKSLLEQERDNEMAFLRQQGQLTNEQLMSQIPTARESFNTLKGNTEATIADLIRGGQMQKDQTSDYYGEAQREAAKNLRSLQGQQQKRFAALGSLDSYGEGSFSEANTNVMSDFNRTTQQYLQEKARKLTEIDMRVKNAERSARQAIVQEEQKLADLERQIQFAVANSDLETAQGLKQSYLNSQKLISDIQDSVAQTKYQFGIQQQELANEMEKRQMEQMFPDPAKSVGAESKLREEFFSRTKDNKYNEVLQQYEKITQAPKNGAGDIGRITAYMKLLDPSSTVKETEFKTAQQAAGRLQSVYGQTLQFMGNGLLSDASRQQLEQAANTYVQPVFRQQQEAEQYYRDLAQQQGLNPNNIVGGYRQPTTQTNQQSDTNNNDPLGIF